MFKNVLVGVDGRAGGRDAVALASSLKDPDGKLTLVHVHGGEVRPTYAFAPEVIKEDREAARTLLEGERAATGVSAELLSAIADNPGRGLHEQAEELGADLIVVGSCAHGLVGRAMLGDDARAALNGASCAAAIAPHGYAEHPVPIEKVGVAYNASPESEAALGTARELARTLGASVHALEVVTIPAFAYAGVVAPASGEGIATMIQQAQERMSKLPGVEGHAVYGLPGEELAVFGDQVDLLVVGSRGYGPLKRLVLGSTSDYLERHARCALLVLPRATSTEASANEQDAGHESAHAS